jgi:serine/threonine-protein kinase
VLTSCDTLSGRYELHERIGAGGSSEVWRGTDVVLARPVAIKQLHAGLAQDAETLSRFRAEGRHAGRLCHENIARVYDYGEPDAPDQPFLVMELIAGPSLASLLRAGPLDHARTARIIAQTAAGLDAAHRAGLIHRDIKPGNLLISPGAVVKVTDFGISAAVDSAPITATNLIIGTPGYLAPERVTGARATPASDLYALGIVAYECLTGSPPFAGNVIEVALAQCEQPLPPLPASVPPELADLIRDLTAKDPGDRPGSATEVASRASQLADRLDAALNIQVSQASLAAAAPSWPPARRRLGRCAAFAVAAAVMVIAGLVTSSEIGFLAPPRTMAEPSSAPTMTGMSVVEVSGRALIGQPVTVAVRQLHQQGLTVHVEWKASGAQAPGSVLSVRPAGRRPVGSLVTVIGALRPGGSRASDTTSGAGHGKGKRHGHGDGDEQGDG